MIQRSLSFSLPHGATINLFACPRKGGREEGRRGEKEERRRKWRGMGRREVKRSERGGEHVDPAAQEPIYSTLDFLYWLTVRTLWT